MHARMLISCHLVVSIMDQVLHKNDLNFWAGATKTGSALAASACCMIAKSIFYTQQTKRSEKQYTNVYLMLK